MSRVSVEKKKAEALGRLKELGLLGDVWVLDYLGRIRMHTQNAEHYRYVEGSDLERLREFERKYDALVFAMIRTFTTDGMMSSYLFVSDYPEEWAEDRRLLKNGEATAYVYNHDAPYCSEVGIIGIKRYAGLSLCRMW